MAGQASRQWGRSGWIHAYRGKSVDAIERFQIARNLRSLRSANFSLPPLASAAAHFESLTVMMRLFTGIGVLLVEQPKRRVDQSDFSQRALPAGNERRRRNGASAPHFGVPIAHHNPKFVDRLASQRQLSRQRVQRP